MGATFKIKSEELFRIKVEKDFQRSNQVTTVFDAFNRSTSSMSRKNTVSDQSPKM